MGFIKMFTIIPDMYKIGKFIDLKFQIKVTFYTHLGVILGKYEEVKLLRLVIVSLI